MDTNSATSSAAAPTKGMDLGVQPLDALMTRLEIANHELVEVSSQNLTHKMVAKGRRGRRLTLNVQDKICNAVNAVLRSRKQDPVSAKELFNYRVPAKDR